jgi:CheY-like chemotaxis protein
MIVHFARFVRFIITLDCDSVEPCTLPVPWHAILVSKANTDNNAEPVGDEMRYTLFECARELHFNAVKHSGATESDVTLLRMKDHHIKLVIRDEGKGFDPGIPEKRRGNESTFGLFSVQQRMAHIGGHMEISTAPGKGTSITLTVPAGKAQPLPESADGASGGIATPSPVPLHSRRVVRRVLVVDDHRIVREGLVGLLQLEPDIEIAGQADDGPQAVELAKMLKPDVIIMDVDLGDMSGIEAESASLQGCRTPRSSDCLCMRTRIWRLPCATLVR